MGIAMIFCGITINSDVFIMQILSFLNYLLQIYESVGPLLKGPALFLDFIDTNSNTLPPLLYMFLQNINKEKDTNQNL